MKSKSLFHLIIAFIIMLCLVWSAQPVTPAHAASLVVTSTADTQANDTFCTLREAIINANSDDQSGSTDCTAGNGVDTITFSASGTITLGSALPNISGADALTIDGTGQSITISGNDLYRIFIIDAGKILSLQHLTMIDANFSGDGGATAIHGTLDVTDCTFSSNYATNGGAAFIGNDPGTLNITNSTFTSNSANRGGILFNYYGNLTILNSTFSSNSSTGDGGGIYTLATGGTLNIAYSAFTGNSAGGSVGGAIFNWGPLIVRNTTFSGNSASQGGGIFNDGDDLTVLNSTFYGNSASVSGGGIYNHDVSGTTTVLNTILGNSTAGGNCSGTMINGGNNIDDGTTCGFGSTNGSMSSTSPQLGSLTGTPAYYPLNNNSPAIDGVTYNAPNSCPVTDQRGQTRADLGCDIGSYELKLSDSHSVIKTISGTGTYTFGPTMVKAVVATQGSLTSLTVAQTDSSHTDATTPLQTGYYWSLDPNSGASDFSVNLTLPALTFTPDDDDKVCRHVSGIVWDCAMNSYTTSSITRNGVDAFSDWTTGNNAGLTAITLQDIRSGQNNTSQFITWVLLAAITGLSLVMARRRQIHR